MVGADWVVGGELVLNSDHSIEATSTVAWGWENGFDPILFQRVISDHGRNVGNSPILTTYFGRLAQSGGEPFTRTDLIADADWYSTPYYQTVQTGLGIDHTLAVMKSLPGRSRANYGFCLTRGRDVKRDFSRRHRAVAAEAERMVMPLLGGPLAYYTDPSPAELPPRMREVLACLLEGDSDKQAARRLRMSPYTVNQYVKAIYTHFAVNSRPELLARWIRRGWGLKRGWLPNQFPPG